MTMSMTSSPHSPPLITPYSSPQHRLEVGNPDYTQVNNTIVASPILNYCGPTHMVASSRIDETGIVADLHRKHHAFVPLQGSNLLKLPHIPDTHL